MTILLAYLRQYWRLVALALALAAVNQIFSLLDPLIFRHVIDEYATRFQEYTTAQFFRVFGVQPMLGRVFLEGEDQAGHDKVVVLSHGFWQRRFGGDPGVVGGHVLLDGERHEIIGVMPAGFYNVFERRTELWAPLDEAKLPNAKNLEPHFVQRYQDGRIGAIGEPKRQPRWMCSVSDCALNCVST